MASSERLLAQVMLRSCHWRTWRRVAWLAVASLVAVPAAAAGAQSEANHVFVATVFDAESGDPVVGAFAAALGTDRFGTTDRNGSFRIDGLYRGTHTIRIWRLGYAPTLFSVTFDSVTVQVLSAPIVLQPIAIEMPEVVVEAERTRIVVGPLRDFYRRRAEARGYFFSRSEIEQRASDELHQLVRVVPGLDVYSVGGFRWRIRMTEIQDLDCPPLFFVDGIQSGESMAMSIRPERLEGIEIYRRLSEVPVEFNLRGSACGVVVLWSRR